ncbi:MAG TPA: GWxTD domain-containing protein [Gemmatimonadales bacterium]
MRRGVLLLVTGVVTACGTRQPGRAADQRPRPDTTLPQLFDAASIYRQMGFIVAGRPLPYVASLRYLGTGTPDSTLGVFALSLANFSLSFRRDDAGFVAEYFVEVTLKRPGTSENAARVTTEEAIRVRGYQETLRVDESVIFQHFFRLTPGDYQISVLVRDRNGPNFARQEQAVSVPRFGGRGISSLVPYYDGPGRQAAAELPRLLLNPRATLPYGGDSLRFYVEAYGAAADSRLAAQALDANGGEIWRDTVPLEGNGTLARGRLAMGAADLPIGQAELKVRLVGLGDSTRAQLLVSFSDRWVITNFEQVTNILRYFQHQDWVRRLREAPVAERNALWREFWKETDPVPLTPENEALSEYFGRVQIANGRFGEEGGTGWLTDRGEVFITLGEPDDVLDLSNEISRGGARIIRWQYRSHRLTVFFRDESGFGRYRLTPPSRGEFQRVVARVRRYQ